MYAAPELRVGWQAGRRTWLSAGVAVMVMSPMRAAKRDETRDEVLLTTGDLAGHPSATMSGTMVSFTPTVGVAFVP